MRATAIEPSAWKIGVFFGSTSYGTQEAAELVRDEFARQAPAATLDLVNVAKRRAEDLGPYDLLVFGTSTWGLGGLQHDWDTFIWELRRADLTGKTAAVFALGDQVVWSETFVDSMVQVHDAAAARGAAMVGSWPTEGYAFDRSESVRDGRFVGLALDRMNQRDLSPERVRQWVGQVLGEWRARTAGAAPAADLSGAASDGAAGAPAATVSPEPILALAPAKVNLSLLVGPRRADGYHPLFTVFVPLDLQDELAFRLHALPRAESGSEGGQARVLTTHCPGVPSEKNLVTRALRLVEEATGWSLAGNVDVRKAIPSAAGLGGGSSDAATALRVGARLVADAGGPLLTDHVLRALARRLGADVPFFLDPRPTIATGVGDIVRPFSLPSLPLVLYLPREELSTPAVYAEFDRVSPPEAASAFATRAEGAEARWLAFSEGWRSGAMAEVEAIARLGAGLLANDLYPAGLSLLPELAQRAAVLAGHGAVGVLMSGSGPTMFGVWGSDGAAAAAAAELASAGHPVKRVTAGS